MVVSLNQSEDFFDTFFVWSSSIFHFELTSLFPPPVSIPGGEQLSTMAADIEALRARWPASPNDLPEAALAVFAAWSRATEETLRKALDDEVGRGFVQPKGTYSKDQKCRDLTILRSPLPRTLRISGVRTALSKR